MIIHPLLIIWRKVIGSLGIVFGLQNECLIDMGPKPWDVIGHGVAILYRKAGGTGRRTVRQRMVRLWCNHRWQVISHTLHGTGILTYIWFIHMVNVGKYTIHACYGFCSHKKMNNHVGYDEIFMDILTGIVFVSPSARNHRLLKNKVQI